jgi:hypothetical protein
VLQAVSASCDATIDAGTPVGDVLYSAQLTIPLDCCDYYTVVRADAALDLCLLLDVRYEIGSDPEFLNPRALQGAQDCWNRTAEEGVAPSALSGTISIAYDSGALLTFDAVVEFAAPPSWLPATLSASFSELRADGEWYAGQ